MEKNVLSSVLCCCCCCCCCRISNCSLSAAWLGIGRNFDKLTAEQKQSLLKQARKIEPKEILDCLDRTLAVTAEELTGDIQPAIPKRFATSSQQEKDSFYKVRTAKQD